MKNQKETPKEHVSEPDGKPLVIGSFSGFNEQMRFTKLLTIATIYQSDYDWDPEIKTMVKMHCNQEASRLGFPKGWQSVGYYEGLKSWFLENCR
ncbi:MAG: hypothetical protein JST52_11725 [Bacteroidetes bacterium]|nr:hypothetical protein [Bacteroidota bacterium]